MGLKKYHGEEDKVFIRLRDLSAAQRVTEYLTNEAVPFEFMPVPDDMYEVLVKREYASVLFEMIGRLQLDPESTGRQQEVVLETTKLYKHEGACLRDL